MPLSTWERVPPGTFAHQDVVMGAKRSGRDVAKVLAEHYAARQVHR